MMKILPLMLLILIQHSALAQVESERYRDLFDDYVMGEYESCLKDALKYTEKSKTDSDPEPYLYVSMCYLKLAEDPSYSRDYPDAFEDALKYASKLKKKDRDNSVYRDNQRYFTTLRKKTNEQVNTLIEKEEYRDATYLLKKWLKIDENDPEVRLKKGVVEIIDGDSRDGSKDLNQAMNTLNERYQETSAEDLNKQIIKEAFILYANHLKGISQKDSARSTIGKAQTWIKNDPDLQKKSNSLK